MPDWLDQILAKADLPKTLDRAGAALAPASSWARSPAHTRSGDGRSPIDWSADAPSIRSPTSSPRPRPPAPRRGACPSRPRSPEAAHRTAPRPRSATARSPPPSPGLLAGGKGVIGRRGNRNRRRDPDGEAAIAARLAKAFAAAADEMERIR